MDARLERAMIDARMASPRVIPEGFLLGAATAAYQIEGAATEGGRGPSIWDTFSSVPGAVIRGENGDVACDHYHRYPEDVALMADLGLDTYRFSISWARVSPDGRSVNGEGWDFYSRLVDSLLERNIRPWLTLYHWDLPQALQDKGGWTSRETADLFAQYAEQAHRVLGDRVSDWTTLNEPWCSSFLSYTGGEHAPGHQSLTEGLLASHHLLLAHGLATGVLRNADSKLDLGITLNLTPAQPLDPQNPGDLRAARLIDGQFNRWFLDPLFRGSYPDDIVEEYRTVEPAAVRSFEDAVHPGDLEVISTPIEILGINYYQGSIVTESAELPARLAEKIGFDRLELPPTGAPATERTTSSPLRASTGMFGPDTYLPRSDQNWQIDPLMLKSLLLRVDEEYSGPAKTTLYVTENGIATDDRLVETQEGPAIHDETRCAYLELHLAATLDAVEQGADVRGFFYWSLLDNFEWAWGYDKRFGLIYVDYDSQVRILKDSAKLYRKIIRDRTLDVRPDAGILVRRGSLVENVPLE